MGERKKLNPEINTSKIQEIYQINLNEIEQLKQNSKNLKELLVTSRFKIEDIISEPTLKIHHLTKTDFFGISTNYEKIEIYTPNYKIQVKPLEENNPIKTIYFKYGETKAENGDIIEVLIPKYQTKIIEYEIFPRILDKEEPSKGCNKFEKYYLDREFREKEIGIEIKIFSELNKLLRTERTTNYNDYFK